MFGLSLPQEMEGDEVVHPEELEVENEIVGGSVEGSLVGKWLW